MVSVHDLLKEYIETGRIKIDKSRHEELATVHDPCNYGRKGEKAFGHGYFEEPRWITQQCCEHFVEMYPNRMNNYCCGAGGGAGPKRQPRRMPTLGRLSAGPKKRLQEPPSGQPAGNRRAARVTPARRPSGNRQRARRGHLSVGAG